MSAAPCYLNKGNFPTSALIPLWRNPPPPVADRASRTFFPHGPKSLKTLLSLIGSSQPTVVSARSAPLVLYPGERFGTSLLASPDIERLLPGSPRPEESQRRLSSRSSPLGGITHQIPNSEVPGCRPRDLAFSQLRASAVGPPDPEIPTSRSVRSVQGTMCH